MSRQNSVFGRTPSSGNSKSTFLYFAEVWVWIPLVAFSLILAACGGGSTTLGDIRTSGELELEEQEKLLLASWLATDGSRTTSVSAGERYSEGGVEFACQETGSTCDITISLANGVVKVTWEGGRISAMAVQTPVSLTATARTSLSSWLTENTVSFSVAAGRSLDRGRVRFSCPSVGPICRITVSRNSQGNIAVTSIGGMASATTVPKNEPIAPEPTDTQPNNQNTPTNTQPNNQNTPTNGDPETTTEENSPTLQQTVNDALEAAKKIAYTSDLMAFDSANDLLSAALTKVNSAPDSTEKTTLKASLDAEVSRMSALRNSIVARETNELAIATAQALNSSSSQVDVDEAKSRIEAAFREFAYIPASERQKVREDSIDAMKLISKQEIRLNPSTGWLWQARLLSISEVPTETVSQIESRQRAILGDHSTYIMSLYAVKFNRGGQLRLQAPTCDAKVCLIGSGRRDVKDYANYNKVPALLNNGITLFDASVLSTDSRIFRYRFGAWIEDAGFAVEKIEYNPGSNSGRTYLYSTVIGRDASRPTGTGTASWSGLMFGMPYQPSNQHFGKNLMGRAAVDYDFSDNTFDARFFDIILAKEIGRYPVGELNFEDIAVDSNGLFLSPEDLGDDPPGTLDRIQGGFFGNNNLAGTFNKSGIIGAFGAKQ